MILFTSLLVFISSSTINPCYWVDAQSINDCKDLGRTSEEYHCCLFTCKYDGYSERFKYCNEITSEQYSNIKQTMKDLAESDYVIEQLYCKSFYLQLSLLSLLFLLF